MANTLLEELARRYIWWKTPDESLSDQRYFLQHAMRRCLFNDLKILEQFFGKEDFIDALQHPTAGIMDEKSWVYWHWKLGFDRLSRRCQLKSNPLNCQWTKHYSFAP
ncbi:MAG: hypothetical protein LBK60_09065 [Verrucomicrobiales bacterium]|jgi:hypothetical protein|nr:hypothetical protein [Verrucomicrobiales bacterium]